MRFVVAAMMLVSTATIAEIPTPPRPVTDPKSLISPVNPEARPVPLEDLSMNRGALDAAWSADGKEVYVVTNLSGRYNIWKTSTSGGWPIQLTRSDETQRGLVPSPDGKTLLFAQDSSGNEFSDIMAISTSGGAARQITNSPQVAETSPRYSPDGLRIAFETKPKESPNSNLAVLDPHTGEVTRLTDEKALEFSWYLVGWTPDGRSLIANREHVLYTVSSVWLIDVATGKATELTPGEDKAFVSASDVSSDGRTIAISSNAGTGQPHVGLLDVASGKVRWLTKTPWEQRPHRFSRDSKTVLVSTNKDGRTTLTIVDLANLSERPLTFPVGVTVPAASNAQVFSPDSRSVLVFHSSASTHRDVWVAKTEGNPTSLTHLSIAGLTNLPKSHIATYRSFDGTLISAVVTMPFNLKRDGSNPAIVVPHGGPTSQAFDSFSAEQTALASRGYIVVAPNFRGSSGYGAAFQAANIKDLGGGDLKDVIAAKDFLVASGYVNPKKVGITGGSYGGFMTLMALGRTPNVFAAGVQKFGIINWYTLLKTEDPLLREYDYGLLGRPETDKAVYDASSPMTYIDGFKAPLLSLQGANDIRTPSSQAEEIADALRGKGTIVETIVYPNEGHGFFKRENQADALRRTVEWFDRYLKGIDTPNAQ